LSVRDTFLAGATLEDREEEIDDNEEDKDDDDKDGDSDEDDAGFDDPPPEPPPQADKMTIAEIADNKHFLKTAEVPIKAPWLRSTRFYPRTNNMPSSLINFPSFYLSKSILR